jgi:autotransporter-associated beta strand protein
MNRNMKRLASHGTRLAALFVLASCAYTQSRPSHVDREKQKTPVEPVDSSPELIADMVQFSDLVIDVLKEGNTSNTYSHQRLYGPRRRLGEPLVQLESSEDSPSFVSTDCSGWLSFALNTVSPLHEAALQSQRSLPEHNYPYSEDFTLRERWRPWARAFVVTQFLRSDYAEAAGFEPVKDFEQMRPGDIGAYAMGRYAKPSDENRPRPKDTGHVFIVTGTPTVVDPKTPNYDGRGTLSNKAAKVIAVPVVDASAIVHFDPDSRVDEKGRFTMPEVVPRHRAKAGGLGSGTIWLALSEDGHAIQRRLGPKQNFRPVLARAARLRAHISLDEAILDDGGSLLVRVFDTSPREYNGLALGETPVNLTGEGGIRLVGGRLVLNGQNDFAGGVTVESGELIVGSPTGLGEGDIIIRGGSVTLQEPPSSSAGSLTLASGLEEGALHLDYKGRGELGALRIGDSSHRCGTWGGPDSRADFVDPVFSGPGMLVIGRDAAECMSVPKSPPKPSRRRRSVDAGDCCTPQAL